MFMYFVNAFLSQLFSIIMTHKTTVVHVLKEYDQIARRHFCNGFLLSVHDGEVDPQLVLLLMRPGFL
jgi:hypothetical protein